MVKSIKKDIKNIFDLLDRVSAIATEAGIETKTLKGGLDKLDQNCNSSFQQFKKDYQDLRKALNKLGKLFSTTMTHCPEYDS